MDSYIVSTESIAFQTILYHIISDLVALIVTWAPPVLSFFFFFNLRAFNVVNWIQIEMQIASTRASYFHL